MILIIIYKTRISTNEINKIYFINQEKNIKESKIEEWLK